MKIRIEIMDDLEEEEVVIRCKQIDASIQRIQQFVKDQTSQASKITFYKEDKEFYFPLEDVLFFETTSKTVYAHTADDSYMIKFRLYELEEILPSQFVRVSKSAILNISQIYSVQRNNFSAASLVQFRKTHKQVYVSRSYYKKLSLRLEERSRYEKSR